MRSVVDVIATYAPAAYSRLATAKPIPSALPAPVTRAVCVFHGGCMRNLPLAGYICSATQVYTKHQVAPEVPEVPEVPVVMDRLRCSPVLLPQPSPKTRVLYVGFLHPVAA